MIARGHRPAGGRTPLRSRQSIDPRRGRNAMLAGVQHREEGMPLSANTESPDLAAAWTDTGFAYLRRAVEPSTVAGMAEAVWAHLASRHAIDRTDPTTWTTAEPRGLGRLRAAAVFDAVATPPVHRAIESLAGPTTSADVVDWGGPLVTFPGPGPWAVPPGGWHLDHPVRGAPGSALRLKWLTFLDRVEPGGGATLVLSGSHHLIARWRADADPGDPGRSAAVRAAIFGTHPWFGVLADRAAAAVADPARARQLDDGVVIGGNLVRVVELTGEPGDVVFLHPLLLHAAAPNRGTRPRMMATGGLYSGR
jgi:hypothetical protein